jgi:hypothetical protein
LNTKTFKIEASYREHTDYVKCLLYSKLNEKIISGNFSIIIGSFDCNLLIWDINKINEENGIEKIKLKNSIYCIGIDDNNENIFSSGSLDNVIILLKETAN